MVTDLKQHSSPLSSLHLVYILMVVVVTWLYPWVKTDRVIHQDHHQQKTRGLMVLKMPSLEGK